MYLRKLEVFGFKSFAERTVFDFQPGMTAIVGPNGCGKSNVSDSIRWVLGEQSAKTLRGSNMQDIIFNGTDTKKPVGFCEVSLTLAETDSILPIEYNEVTVTRRLYRTGESEYALNKSPCRLRDIQELFRGTGVGSNPYSMIAQGNIDMILSSKPEDRRFVFEEAAGITRFKAQKKEALRKLDNTESNLVRVSDIIREVKKQIGVIQRQANKAQRYKERKDELKSLECQHYQKQYLDLNTEMDEKKIQIENANQAKQQSQQNVHDFEIAVSELRLELEELSQALAQKNAQQVILNNDEDRLLSESLIHKERLEETKLKTEQWSEETRLIDQKLKDIESQKQNINEELTQVLEEVQQMTQTVSLKQDQFTQMLNEIHQIQEDLKQHKSQIAGSLSEETEVKNELMQLEVDGKALAQEKERIEKELEESASWLVQEKEDLDALIRVLSEEENQLNEKEKKFIDQRETLVQVRTQLESLDREIAQKSASFSEKKSRLDVLQDMKSRFEGYYQGVKLVLQESQRENGLKGICGAVADLLHVPREYEIAIEVALGARVQNIVAETAEDVKRAIFFLKESNGGQATFLPLDLLRSGEIYQLPERWSNSGVIGNACDFVEFDPKYYKIFKTLLGNTILVRDMDSALEVARNDGVHCQLVTLEGDAINSRGAITGGSNKNKVRGFISREGQIEELKQSVSSFEGEMNAFLDKRNEKVRHREELELEVHELQSQLNHERVAVATKQNEKVKMESALQKSEEDRQLFDIELSSVSEKLNSTQQRADQIRQQLDSAVQLNLNLQSNMTSGEKDLLDRNAAKDVVQEELTQLKISLAQIQEKEKTFELRQQQLEQTKQDLERTLVQHRQEIDEAVKRGEEAAKVILKLEGDLDSLHERKEGFGSELEVASKQRQEAADRIHEKESELAQARSSLTESQEKVHRLQITLTEEKLHIDNLVAKAAEEYHVDLTANEIEIPEEINWDELAEKVLQLRSRIESMGPVNLIAIEELEEAEERHQFLEKQHNDLIDSKKQLLDAIDKINTTMTEKFVETFEQVRENFKETFTKLFNGGKGDILIMEDNPDVLEAGIDIVARPPGKKLTSVSLMSGGERALTAVALLFALFKVKPSPFCVLDEIDAPLDESNIKRFVDMVKEYLVLSQFIVVTHNKRTISASDAMYGITMEESGVSKVVSVKFAQKDELAEVTDDSSNEVYGFAGR